MKLNHTFWGVACLLLIFITACQKERSLELGKLPSMPLPPKDTTQKYTPPDTTQPAPGPQPVSITIQNPGFENWRKYWKKETTYKGANGFRAKSAAAHTGKLGLNFFASQAQNYEGAPQETPWNGKIYQTIKGLQDGRYTFKIYADAVGNGMYLWADGGAGEVKVPIKSDNNEINTLDFNVKGGVAKFGFICINADGMQRFAPYFHADDAELLMQ